MDDVTIDKDEAAKILNERVNAIQIAKDKRLNEILNGGTLPGGTNPNVLGNGKDTKPTTTWAYLVAFLIAVSTGLFFWKKKQKNKKALVFQQK